MPITKSRQIAKLFKSNGIIKESFYDSDAIVTSAQLGVTAAAGTTTYSSADTLPAVADNGDQAFVSSTNRLYIFNGSGWYNIALINTAPYWSSEASSSYDLSTTGAATVITILAIDSEGVPVTYTATADSDFNQIATITKDSDNGRTFTIIPTDSENGTAVAGTGTVTFKASDGVNLVSTLSTFSLTFGPDWSVAPTETKISASDAEASDAFGESVSISSDGSYAIVGARTEDTGGSEAGAAYIFSRSGSTWTQQQKIQASDAQATDYFGYSVAMSSDGTYAIVGAIGEDTGGSAAGAAYIFSRSGSTWTQQQKITASNAGAGDEFGKSVSISSDGTYAIVGAYGEDTVASLAGAAYIFTRSGSTWTQQQKIQASDAQANDYFGWSSSISSDGTYAIVGAYGEDTGGADAGAAYVFTRSGSTWTQQAKIVASDAEASDEFGKSVSISSDGTYAIVGARLEDTGGSNAGAAYIFSRSGSTWTEQAKITASDAEADDYFGHSVAMSSNGNYAIVGAYGEDTGAALAGAAYIFSRSGSTWTQQQKIQASDAAAIDFFGESVSINSDGTYAIVGAKNEDGGVGNPTSNAGAAYIYEA